MTELEKRKRFRVLEKGLETEREVRRKKIAASPWTEADREAYRIFKDKNWKSYVGRFGTLDAETRMKKAFNLRRSLGYTKIKKEVPVSPLTRAFVEKIPIDMGRYNKLSPEAKISYKTNLVMKKLKEKGIKKNPQFVADFVRGFRSHHFKLPDIDAAGIIEPVNKITDWIAEKIAEKKRIYERAGEIMVKGQKRAGF